MQSNKWNGSGNAKLVERITLAFLLGMALVSLVTMGGCNVPDTVSESFDERLLRTQFDLGPAVRNLEFESSETTGETFGRDDLRLYGVYQVDDATIAKLKERFEFTNRWPKKVVEKLPFWPLKLPVQTIQGNVFVMLLTFDKKANEFVGIINDDPGEEIVGYRFLMLDEQQKQLKAIAKFEYAPKAR